MSLSRSVHFAAFGCAVALGFPGSLLAQGTYATNGAEYAITASLPGDQVRPQLALGPSGGYLLWQDNITDGNGLGISAQRLDSTFSPVFAPFRINATGVNDQERPQIALLNNGGAAFVWQGGKQGYQHIYAQFLGTNNTGLMTNDILVNAVANKYQQQPVVATLTSGNVIVVYASMNQQSSNSLQDVYGQLLSPTGQKIGGEFLINQFTSFNQRNPAVTALASGGFVVAWVSEQQRSGDVDSAFTTPTAQIRPGNYPSVDVYTRVFNAAGAPVTGEILVNTSSNLCANPHLAGAADGSFMVVWGEKNFLSVAYSWDVYSRPFSSSGAGGNVQVVNTRLAGDQYLPQIAALGTDYLVVWTSLGQDGSREGVFGQFLRSTGAPVGGEFQVNTTAIGQQIMPVVASDGVSRFVVAWSSFVGGISSFDLFAQRYMNFAAPLQPMDAPYVFVPYVLNSSNVYQPQLRVSWAAELGLPLDHYEVYVDGAASPSVSLTTNLWLMTAANGLKANATHSFQVAYVVPDGRRSPLSPTTTVSTWSGTSFNNALPIEWMAQYYGYGNTWPSANSPLSPGGPTLIQVFLTGANPLDPSTWLRTSLVGTPEGYFLTWNPQPGLIYQVQTSANLSSWSNVGAPRFAAGTVDSVFVGGNNTAYYRVLRMR